MIEMIVDEERAVDEEAASERARVAAEAEGGTKADAARSNAGQQVFDLVVGSETTGSARMVAVRFGELIEATRTEDSLLIRAASMELARASVLYAVRLDLRGHL